MKNATPFRHDRGITMGVVILLVLVTMVLCFGALALWAKKAEITREKTRLQGLKNEETAAVETIRKMQDEGVAPTGLGPKEGEEVALSPDISSGKVKELRPKVFEVAGAPPVSESVLAYREDQYSTFQSLLGEMAHRVNLLTQRAQRAESDAKLAKQYLETKVAAKPEVLKDREAFRARLNQQIRDLNDRINEITTKFNETKTGLTAQIDKLKGEIEVAEAEYRDFERRETGKIKKMQHDLDQMRQKEVIKHRVNEAHGKVLKPDVAQKNAFIDLGSQERVVPGLRFVAARVGKEGKFEYKALLEVKKVWLETSEVAIVKAYPDGGPVIEGDLIINPFYNPRRAVVVAFAGHTGDRTFNLRRPDNNPKPLRLTAREAANRIKEIGSEARMNVALDADFVIFTEVTDEKGTRDSWPDYTKAVLLEIPLADAADYYEFLGG